MFTSPVLQALTPQKYSNKNLAIKDVYLKTFRDMGLDEIRAYAAAHLRVSGGYDPSITPFILDIFLANPYVKYNIRNRAIISIELFCVIVESLFSGYYTYDEMRHVEIALEMGLNPLFTINLIVPYFLRVIDVVLWGPSAAGPSTTGPSTTGPSTTQGTKYYLSFTVLKSRLSALLESPTFCKVFAFVSWDDFRRSIDDIFKTFRHLGSDGVEHDAAALKAEILEAWQAARMRVRAELRCRGLTLREELVARVFHPGRVWRLSQAQSMYAWEWLDLH